MKVFRDLKHLPDFRNSVITIGSFDGIHHGHQEILSELKERARRIDGETVVITFHPHPRQIVFPQDKSLQLLTSIEEKIKIFQNLDIDNLVIVPFTVEFSRQSADEYIHRFLYKLFKPKYIVIGYDHKFGLNRQGDINYLRSYSDELGFKVKEIDAQTEADIVVSSTKIRNALNAGEVALANQLLQYNFIISGIVGTGQNLGTKIGYPTANITVTERHKLIPRIGIYAVVVQLELGRFGGMLYIGNRPTIDDGDHISIEVNIFDFYHNIYGEKISVELIDWVRADAKFDNVEELKKQLAQDKIDSIQKLNKLTDLSIQV